MILIFGGAYQGKTEYAKERFHIAESDVFCCDDGIASMDTEAALITGLEKFILACVSGGIDPEDALSQYEDELADKIIICNDISQGIVPLDETERAWREAVGRCMVYLSGKAAEVHRVFCGIGERIR